MSTRLRQLDLVASILPGEAKGPLEQDNLAATLAWQLHPSCRPVAGSGSSLKRQRETQVRIHSCICVVVLGARPEGESVTDME